MAELASREKEDRQLAAMVGAAEHASLDSLYLFGEGDDCRCQGCGSQECSDGDGLDRSLPPRK